MPHMNRSRIMTSKGNVVDRVGAITQATGVDDDASAVAPVAGVVPAAGVDGDVVAVVPETSVVKTVPKLQSLAIARNAVTYSVMVSVAA